MSDEKSSNLKELLGIIGIKQIIWIDDCFSQPTEDNLKNVIKSKLVELLTYDQKPSPPILASLNYNVPDPIFEKQIDNLLDEHLEDLSDILDSLIEQINALAEAEPEDHDGCDQGGSGQ